MTMTSNHLEITAKAVEKALQELVQVTHHYDGSFVNLPILYPDGSSVTVQVRSISSMEYSVSDYGFAYRQLETVGAENSWSRVARRLTKEIELESEGQRIFAQRVAETELFRAICDVATTSWQVVEKVYASLSDESDADLEDELFARLKAIFGSDSVSPHIEVAGSSSSKWDFTALVKDKDRQIVFQAVSPHAASVYRTNTAFHDVALRENPPTRIAVVREKAALGSRVSILAQAGRVIEWHDGDAVYRRAAMAEVA